MEYTRDTLLDMCKKALTYVKTFYQSDMINYRGKTSDTNEYYTEVIAEFVCDNLMIFQNEIPVITRSSSYKSPNHLGEYSESSNRTEEIFAIKMFNQSKAGCKYDFIGKIIDYQTPLKSARSDVAGKIDLLSYDGKILRILELKKPDSTETMLRCVLEGYTYMKTVNSQKLLSNFCLPEDTLIKACPFVFHDGVQYQEMKENRPWLKKLMKELDSVPYYIKFENDMYYVLED